LFTPQFVAQGTVFTGNDGVRVVTAQPATIPPGNPTTGYGTVTVLAQAVQTGAAGNIAIADINITINNGLLVKNSQFSGGEDDRTFSVVTLADIQQLSTQLTPRLLQSEQAALMSQLQAGEQLFQSTCTPTTNTDHQPGDEATHVKVTVSETCTAEAYNQQVVQAQGEQLLNEKARKGCRLVGDIRPTLLTKQEAASIRVQFTGTYIYQINQQALIALIAGQPRQHALILLTKIAGIQHATIAGITDDNPVPVDPAYIHLQVLMIDL
jgi:hypothetical protein